MATLTRVSTVCDVCRNPKRRTKTFRVTMGDGAVVLILCTEHRKPLESLLKHGTLSEPPKRPGPPVKLWEMSEIEALKK